MSGPPVRIGSIDIAPVADGTGREKLTDVVAHTGNAEWDCPEHPVDDEGRLELDFGGYLVRTGPRTILVDAGVGKVAKENISGGGLLDSMTALGVHPDDITDVVFTHLHWDHVGWATQHGRVTFTNATHRVHAAEWRHFVDGPDAVPGAIRKIGPLASRLEVFDAEIELAPGFIARPSPGHTPGSTIFVVADAGERALLLGDVVHAIGELTDPEWHGLYDVDPVAARAVRDHTADEADANGDLVAAGHFPGLGFGRLITASGRRRFLYL
jgi:glyoxylase-like metal-dependent hydrolase (beta-lactamase superfamily II)